MFYENKNDDISVEMADWGTHVVVSSVGSFVFANILQDVGVVEPTWDIIHIGSFLA